ncbi:MAG: S8 family peptidase [Oscillospiraceae bacterium]|nr:S8 family peptidase [Oscillospiraceae bacterium]
MDSYIDCEKNKCLLQKLLLDPDSVAFVIRKNQYSETLINKYDIALAKTLLGQYTICYSKQDIFSDIRKKLGAGVISIRGVILGLLDNISLKSSGITQVHDQPYLNLRGEGVIIGFVDTGIDYTLDIFRYEDGSSKIVSIYDQTIEDRPPEGFYFGTEYTNNQINAALKSDNPKQLIPEEDVSGHGTFLASVAAGRETADFIGAAPDAEIIAVKLRKAAPYYLDLFSVPEAQNYAFESSNVMIGIEYILEKASRLNKPVVICLGLGTNFGSHDGYTIFEEYLNNVSNLKGVCLCIAAGNESQAKHHAEGLITATGETQDIDIIVGENTGNALISIWTGVSDRVSVSIRSPTGELVPRIPAHSGSIFTTKLLLEGASIGISYYFPIEGTGGQLTAIKLINPTPGTWTITVFGEIILNGKFNAWLPMTGFVDPSIIFLAPNPNYTVTIPATMIGAIVCGAYNSSLNSLYSYSSWGPTSIGNLSPDLVAPGVNIDGFYPYGRGTMDGTSAAAAITAGAAALMLQWGIVKANNPSMSTYHIKAYMIRGCNRSENMTYPNNRWGYGSLNLIQAFQIMKEM